MVKTTNNLLVALFAGIFYIFGTPAFSQSTPPLDKPIEKPPIDQMSESGRIQEKIDKRRNKQNSPDSDINHSNNPNVNPVEDHSGANHNILYPENMMK